MQVLEKLTSDCDSPSHPSQPGLYISCTFVLLSYIFVGGRPNVCRTEGIFGRNGQIEFQIPTVDKEY